MYSKDSSATTTLWTVKADWSVCVTAPSFHTVTQQLLSGNSSGIEAASVIRKLSYHFSFMWWCQFEHLWLKLQTPRGVLYFWENTAQSGETTEVSRKIWISDVSFNINWIAVVFPFFFFFRPKLCPKRASSCASSNSEVQILLQLSVKSDDLPRRCWLFDILGQVNMRSFFLNDT